MRLDTSLNLKMDTRMILAPRMIQSMEILQLPIMALQERLSQELEENPALELKENTNDDITIGDDYNADSYDNGETLGTDGPMVMDEHSEADFNRLEAMVRDYDGFNEDHRPSRNGIDDEIDRKHDAMSNMPSRPQSLQDYLEGQLQFLELEPRALTLVQYLISNINDHGYLKTSLGDVVQSYPEAITLAEAEDALSIVHDLDPLGVGARDHKECLLLQVTSETPHRDLVRLLILNHLEDVALNRLPIIQKRTSYDINTIKEAIEALRRLDPKPGARFTAESIPYVTPDIVVERDETGDYSVRLVDDWIPEVHIPRHVIELAKNRDNDTATKDYIRKKIQSASWLLDAINQRRSTLEKVTKAIVRHQRAFLDQGPDFIEPLKMQQIADDVKVHVTTVSRAVDDKWVQTPRGIFPLKRFFGGGTQTSSGEEVAWETIKNKLLELIGNEDKASPLSDEELVDKLQDGGYPIARRTITKYRKMLHIPSSRQRKDWALK